VTSQPVQAGVLNQCHRVRGKVVIWMICPPFYTMMTISSRREHCSRHGRGWSKERSATFQKSALVFDNPLETY